MGKVYSMTIKYLDSKRIVGLSQSSITHDTTSATESSGSVSSLTHSMTIANNSNRVLIACVSSYGSAPTITGVTWNGVAMTAVPNSESYQAGSNNRTQIYYIIAPATGSHSIVASYSGSATCSVGGMSFYNVNQTTPVEAGNTSSATATATSSLALTPTVTGSWIIAMISSSSSVGTATGLTQSYALNANALVRGGRNESPTIGSANTVGWGSSSSGHAMSGCAIIPYGDAKPTNVQDNSILVEKDTGRRYWFDAESTVTPTLSDDFSSDLWTDNDSTKIGVSSNAMQFNCVTDGSVDNSIRSMTTVSDTNWILQFKLNFTSLAQAGAGDNNLYIGLTAGNQTTSMNAGADNHVYVYHQTNNSGSKNKFILNSTGGTQDIGTFAPTTGVDYYCTITRSSATTTQFIIRITSHTGAIQETLDVTNGTATTTLINGIVANRDASLTSGSKTGTVDDWNFYSGVTSVTTPATWTWSNDKTRGVFGGGSTTNDVNTMDYIIIATLGNAVDFGDLTVARRALDGVSSDVRGVFGGGENGSRLNVMDYITIATAGNATDFGDLTVARRNVGGVSSDAGRGVFGGGYGSTYENTMDYITIATTGNATDFGNLTVARTSPSGCNSDVRGVISGGNGSNVMDYITIATTGNATDFGDLSTASGGTASVDSDVRGVIQNGNVNNVIDYITIATAGNATDFGDSLQVSHGQGAGVSGTTRGVFGGGYNTSNVSQNYIEYVTIATLGNAIDFGDLSQARAVLAGVQS